MMQSRSRCSVVALLVLVTVTSSSPVLGAHAFTPPKTTLPTGAVNPFYPCGTDPNTCQYRCYVLPAAGTNSTKNNLATLQPQCFSKAQASAFVDLSKHPKSEGHTCVKCVQPNAVEVPNSTNAPLSCQPLDTYFHSTASYGTNALTEYGTAPLSPPYPYAALPARCGTRADPIKDCGWTCAAAQVPFSLCDSHNTTGEYRQCLKCVPQCSSPVTVGGLGTPARGPDLSNVGNCAKGVASVECLWSCSQAGRESASNSSEVFRFCSVVDKTNTQNGEFVSCARCPQDPQ